MRKRADSFIPSQSPPAELVLSLPIGSHRHPEAAVKDAMSAGSQLLCDTLTGGSCTVEVCPLPDAVLMEGPSHGRVRVRIGRCERLEETLLFQIDWGWRAMRLRID